MPADCPPTSVSYWGHPPPLGSKLGSTGVRSTLTARRVSLRMPLLLLAATGRLALASLPPAIVPLARPRLALRLIGQAANRAAREPPHPPHLQREPDCQGSE